MGAVALRSQADFSAESVQFVTLNHEGGLPVKVLETGSDATHGGADGTWFLEMTTGWAWAQTVAKAVADEARRKSPTRWKTQNCAIW